MPLASLPQLINRIKRTFRQTMLTLPFRSPNNSSNAQRTLQGSHVAPVKSVPLVPCSVPYRTGTVRRLNPIQSTVRPRFSRRLALVSAHTVPYLYGMGGGYRMIYRLSLGCPFRRRLYSYCASTLAASSAETWGHLVEDTGGGGVLVNYVGQYILRGGGT